MTRRILFATGGTGGHIYPAVATATEILAENPEYLLQFAGGKLKSNLFLQGANIIAKEIECSPLAFSQLKNFPLTSFKIYKGFRQSCQLIDSFSPELIVAFGSYYTFPLLLAARYKKVPYILHEANAIGGRVNRFFASKAKACALVFPSVKGLKENSVATKMPIRFCSSLENIDKKSARSYFQLDPEKTTLLIFGGSQGAKAINKLFASLSKEQWSKLTCQILHITGQAEETSALEDSYKKVGIKATVLSFEPRMNLAWTAADLCISRAGGSTLAEAVEFAVPLLLIPFPFAKDNHQYENSLFMEKILAAKVLEEKDANADRLSAILNELLQKETLKQMQDNLIHYRNQQSSWPTLSQLILSNLRNPL